MRARNVPQHVRLLFLGAHKNSFETIQDPLGVQTRKNLMRQKANREMNRYQIRQTCGGCCANQCPLKQAFTKNEDKPISTTIPPWLRVVEAAEIRRTFHFKPHPVHNQINSQLIDFRRNEANN